MYRSRLVPCILLVALVVASCDDPTSAPHIVPTDLGPAFSLQDASAGGSAGFYFLPPLVPNPAYGGVADMERSPRVDICEVGNDECTQVKTFSGSDILTEDEHYKVEWNAGASDAKVGVPYRIHVSLGLVTLGSTDVVFEAGGNARRANSSQEVGVNRTVPVRFRIEEGAAFAAVKALEDECETDDDIIYCDVQEGTGNAEVEAIVFAVDGKVAGVVRVFPGSTDEPFIIFLKHLKKISGADFTGLNVVGEAEKVPYFLEAKVLDLDGNDVGFHPEHPAYLALCQPNDVPSSMIELLSIFKVDSRTGQTTIKETRRDATECSDDNHHNDNDLTSLPLLQRMQGGLSRVAGFFRAQPLGAIHGGLHTLTPLFSEFGAVQTEEGGPRIVSPSAGEKVTQSPLSLLAFDPTAPDNTARWAVRHADGNPNCVAGSSDVHNIVGNVDGMTHSSDYTGGQFAASVDISSWADGNYCFALNTVQGPAAGNRLIQFFSIEFPEGIR